jgi:hypothetical protein
MSGAWPVQIVAWALWGGLLAAPGCATRPQNGAEAIEVEQADELSRIRAAVERALESDPPRGYEPIPRGVRLLAVTQDEDVIVLNLSAELLTSSTRVIEDAVRQILMAASSARDPRNGRVDEFRVLVNGVTLESYLP